jgi:hypothetical protein
VIKIKESFRKHSTYNISLDYKELAAQVKRLNKLMKEGTQEEAHKAKLQLDNLTRPFDDEKSVCIVRTIKKKYPTKYTNIPTVSGIKDDDICVIYKLRGAQDKK